MARGGFCFAYILNEYTNSVSIFHLRRNKYCYEKHRRTQYRSNSLAYLSRAQAQQRVDTTNYKSFEINSRLRNCEKFFESFLPPLEEWWYPDGFLDPSQVSREGANFASKHGTLLKSRGCKEDAGSKYCVFLPSPRANGLYIVSLGKLAFQIQPDRAFWRSLGHSLVWAI